jgi:phosphatidate cytidylyltransferase
MGRQRSELLLRIHSALILVSVALLLTYAGLEAFAVLITLFMIAMAWEWGRLVRGGGLDVTFALQLLSTAVASWATVRGCIGCALSAVILGTMAVFLFRLGKEERSQAWWSAAGVYYAGLPAIALIWIRSDAEYGWLAIMYIFAIVWTTDSAAYLFGRWIGGAKLAPRISPKKTWAGLIGGALSAGAAGLIFAVATGIGAPLRLALLGTGLALVSQVGDLGESALKRSFGIKDSSSLIPGHGGVLDRIDGLVFAAVTAALIAWAVDAAHPGRALLLWP